MPKPCPHNGTDRNPLQRLCRYSIAHPVRVLVIALVLTGVSIGYTAAHLRFKTARNDLISINDPAVKRYRAISDDFGKMTHATVVVEGYDPDRMKGFILDLAHRLRTEPEIFQNLFFKIDTASLDGKKLLYLSADELEDLKKKLSDYRELIEELTFSPRMDRILAFVNQKISEATVSHLITELIGVDGPDKSNANDPGNSRIPPPTAEKDPVDLGFLRSLLVQMRLSLRDDYRFQSPWDTFFDTGVQLAQDGFLMSDGDRFAFMVLDLKGSTGGFTKNKAALERLRGHLRALAPRYPELTSGVTGEVALATDEMAQAFRDTLWATVVALAGIGLLFMLVFRQVSDPAWVLVSLTAAICWTFGWLTLTVGHLTILSVAFTPILLGLGVDFGIHLLARYREEAGSGRPFDTALNESFRYTGKAITAAALTTAIAFFAILLADFRGIQELGFIAGSGVLLSLLSTFTVLPALLAVSEKNRPAVRAGAVPFQRTLGCIGIFYRHPRWTLAATILISTAAAAGLGRVCFDYNLLNLQAEGTESVVWERRIIAQSERSSWFALATASSLAEARRKDRLLGALPIVRKVDSLADLVPQDQKRRIESVRSLAPLVAHHRFETDAPEPPDIAELMDLLEKIKFKLRTDITWDPGKKPAEEEIRMTRNALLALIADLQAAPAETARRRMAPFQQRLFSDFKQKFQLLKHNADPPGPILESDIPESLRQRFRGQSGAYLLRIHAEKNIWEKAPMAEFVTGLQQVEPEVTGSPVVGYMTIHLMKKGYLQGSLYALGAVCVVIWAAFRRSRHAALALIPLGLTGVWTLGWMGWTGVPFNLANVIALPLILGIVVDDGIHVVHRYRETPAGLEPLISGSTAQAVTLTSWTTMIGFGSLMISKHFGIFSLGLVVTAAVGAGWLLSLVVLPVILNGLRKKPPRHHPPDA